MRRNTILIEDDDCRRIGVLHHLTRRGHCVIPCSSVSDAEEIVRDVRLSTMAPHMVILAEPLLHEGGARFRIDLDERFRGVHWILLPRARDLLWLSDQLGQVDRPDG